MDICYRIKKQLYYFRRKIWEKGRVPFHGNKRVYLAQRLFMVFHGLFVKDHWMSAAQLSFNTLMALIPVLAIIYAVASGFGFGDIVVEECRKAFSSQPKIANALVTLSRNYIQYTHTGPILGFCLLLLLYSVYSLFTSIEAVFNNIWDIRVNRSLLKSFVDCLPMFLIIPILIILFSGLSIFFYRVIDYITYFRLLAPGLKVLINFILPWLLLTIFFLAMFSYMPNATVQLRSILLPSVLTALLIILLQTGLVYAQVLFTSYNIIYGSLSALPLLMLWMQLSWYIIIGAAEWAHADQAIGQGNLYQDKKKSFEARLNDCIIIVNLLCRRQGQPNGGTPYTIKELLSDTQLGYHDLYICLRMLADTGLIHRNLTKADEGTPVFLLRKDSSAIRLGDMISVLCRFPNTANSSARHSLTPSTIARINALRTAYIDGLNNLLVKDCVEP